MVDVKSSSLCGGRPPEFSNKQTLTAATAALVAFRRGGKFACVLCGGVIKLSLAAGAAEIVCLPFVFAMRASAARFDFHTAYGIFYCCCGHYCVLLVFGTVGQLNLSSR